MERHPAHERACDAMPSNDYQSSTIFDGAVRPLQLHVGHQSLKVMLAYGCTAVPTAVAQAGLKRVRECDDGSSEEMMMMVFESVSVFRPSFLLQIC